MLRTQKRSLFRDKEKIFAWRTLKCARRAKTKESLSSRFMFWLLLEKGAGRSYVGSSSFHFSSATQPRSWIRAPLAPPRRRRRHQRLHLPCHLSSPRVSPPAPPGEIRGGFLDRGKERSATNFLKKKTSKSSGKCFSWLAGSTATASRHRCTLAIFPHGKREEFKKQ